MFRTGMTLDRTNRAMTLLCAFVVLGAFVGLSARGGAVMLLLVPVVVVLGFAWAMSPCEIVIDARELRILRRAWRPMRIPLAAIASATPLDHLGVGTIRLFGVGGFFGSYGVFTNAALGRFRLYATRRGAAVVVRRRDGKPTIVFTPNDAAGTMKALTTESGMQT
jgi:hypothetical protein